MAMARRTYNQYCGLSRSLDLVGERWTLLIIRELMAGPKRYTDLADALDGIGTSLLAARIKQLDDDGLISRNTLPPPAASQVYELTPAGRELAAALVPLAMWGMRHHFDEPRRPEESYRAEWTLVFLATLIDPPADMRATIQFHIDGSAAVIVIDDGRATVTPGELGNADATVTTDLHTLGRLGTRQLDPADVVDRVQVTGDTELALRLLGLVIGNR
ncbi:winged helix-turn-helix transcriptional regulator [Nocardia sp. NPDC049526]|uniref:winged helix-turn-helix transcriptional regulator n=1 Tax=Nocardia sp. NPDC049526 TaxID=3364316 RepID=UPI0037953FEF